LIATLLLLASFGCDLVKKMMMMTMEGMMDKGVLDDIIRRLLEGRGGKQVQLSEGEIRQLCVNARQIFLIMNVHHNRTVSSSTKPVHVFFSPPS
jgi:hypothetical protein